MEVAMQNTLASLSGMMCDGAKNSCALKVSTCVFSAMQAAELALNNQNVQAHEGVIGSNVSASIASMARLSKEGLSDIDRLLLDIMLKKSQ